MYGATVGRMYAAVGCLSMERLRAKYADVGRMYADVGCLSMERLGAFIRMLGACIRMLGVEVASGSGIDKVFAPVQQGSNRQHNEVIK